MKFNLNKLSGNINLKKDGKFLGFGASPQLDWRIILSAFLFCTVLVIVLNVLVFVKIDKGEIFEVSGPSMKEEGVLDIDLLRTATSYYKNKETQFNKIIGVQTATTTESKTSTSTKSVPPFGSAQ